MLPRWIDDGLFPPVQRYLRYGRSLRVKRILAALLNGALTELRPREFVAETLFGSAILGSTEDRIETIVYLFGIIEDNLTYWLWDRLQPGDVFVDVGAHVGYFSLIGSVAVGERGSVVAIEASPRIFARLSRNVSVNEHAKNVRTLNVAAHDSTGRLDVFPGPEGLSGWTTVHAPTANQLSLKAEASVNAGPLHELLTPEELARARVVKIDVEGSEFQAVGGLLPALTADRMRPDLEVVVETAPRAWQLAGAHPKALVELFADVGFNAYLMPKEVLKRPHQLARPRRVRSLVADLQPAGRAIPYADLVFSRQDRGWL